MPSKKQEQDTSCALNEVYAAVTNQGAARTTKESKEATEREDESSIQKFGANVKKQCLLVEKMHGRR